MRVLIAYDRDVIRKGLNACLNKASDIEVVGVCANLNTILKKARRLLPDIILMDSYNNGDSVKKIIRQIYQEIPGTRIVIMTPFMLHNHDPLSYLDLDANGYLDLDINTKQLVETLTQIHNGGKIICPSITQPLIEREKNLASKISSKQRLLLSKREMQVLSLMAEGQSNQEIAEAMFISGNTVKAHIQNILKKMKVQSRVQAVFLATQKGMIKSIQVNDFNEYS